MDTAKTISELKMQLESAWGTLKPKYLQTLVDGMPERIKICIKLIGNFISKCNIVYTFKKYFIDKNNRAVILNTL